MSFDADFDYTNAKTQLDGQIVNYTNLINAGNAEISMYGNITGYGSLVSEKVSNLTYTNNLHAQLKGKRENAKAEMQVLESLPAQDKSTLYDFWIIAGESKPRYMKRIMFNHANGLLSQAGNIVADGNLSPAEAQAVGGLLCAEFPISQDVLFVQENWFQ